MVCKIRVLIQLDLEIETQSTLDVAGVQATLQSWQVVDVVVEMMVVEDIFILRVVKK
jgi:hypothetical protein